LREPSVGRYSNPNEGPLAIPGNYSVELWLSDNGALEQLVEPVAFEVLPLENSTLGRQTEANVAFKRDVQELRRKIRGSAEEQEELNKRLAHIKEAIQSYPGADVQWMKEVKALEAVTEEIRIGLMGDYHKSKREVETVPGTVMRIENIVWNTWYSTSNPTNTNKEQFELAGEEYALLRKKLDDFRSGIEALETKLDGKNVPYTPHRPDWKED